MEYASQDEAWRILECHVGKSIPRDIKVVERLIEQAYGNPLILALISSEIDPDRAQDETEWQSAWNNFEQILRSSETKKFIYGKRYGKSYFSAMQLSIQSLTPRARDLLTLLHLCEGPSVPEEVIQVLYGMTRPRLAASSLSRLRMELESRKLLTVSTTSSRLDSPLRSWSLHSLTKRFIENEMGDSKTSILKSLRGVYWEFYLCSILVAMCMLIRQHTIWEVGTIFSVGLFIHKFISCEAIVKNGYRKYMLIAVAIPSFFVKLMHKCHELSEGRPWLHVAIGFVHMVERTYGQHSSVETKTSVRLAGPASYFALYLVAFTLSRYCRAKTWSYGLHWESEIVKVLSAIYLDGQHHDMRSAWEAIAHPRGRLNGTIVRAIEPVTRLLGQPQSDLWPRSAKQSAAQVFLNYICLDRWDVDGINHLISLPVSTLPMLEALERMLKVATDCDTLQDLLEDKADLCLKGVVEFTMFVARKGDKIGQWPLLKAPLELFCKSNNSAVQDLAGNILVKIDEICRCTGRSLLQRSEVEGLQLVQTMAVNELDWEGNGDVDPRRQSIPAAKDVLQHLLRQQDEGCDHRRARWIDSKMHLIEFGPGIPFCHRLVSRTIEDLSTMQRICSPRNSILNSFRFSLVIFNSFSFSVSYYIITKLSRYFDFLLCFLLDSVIIKM